MKARMIMVYLLAAAFAGTIRAADKSPALLLQEGLYAEEADGDLDKAIEIYGRIPKNSGQDEQISAQAAYQIGLCFLKKGQTEKAAEYFRKVVTYYPQQTSLVEKAQARLNQIQPADNQETTQQIIGYLLQQHLLAWKKTKEAGLPLTSIACYIDESGRKTEGGFLSFENESGNLIQSETAAGHLAHSNIEVCYNEKLQPQQFRMEDTGRDAARYVLMWTPDHPVQPGEVVTLIYKSPDEFLPRTDTGCRLEMSHSYGPEVLENIFLALPVNMHITKGLDGLTAHQRISQCDVYVWQTRVPKDTTSDRLLDIEIIKEVAESSRPAVASSSPQTGSDDVDPNLNTVTVTFDQDMFQSGWAWCQVAGPYNYPEVTGTPRYIDSRTCALPVKLLPAKSYLLVVNAPPYDSFKSTDQVPAKEYAIVFATADASGNPTEIAADLLKKAQEINAQNALPEPVLDILPSAAREYIAGHFYQTWLTAQAKGLNTNSHVHILDSNWNRNVGMVQVFKNSTNQVIDREIQMGSNDSPDICVYDQEGVRQKIRTYKIPNSNYRYFWTPSSPVEPNETRMLLYSSGSDKLYPDYGGRYTLNMGNHYGPPVIETFYVVLPSGIELTDQSEPFTGHETIDGLDVYCWSKEQGANQNHQVDIVLAKKK
jgi:hypothetical protein